MQKRIDTLTQKLDLSGVIDERCLGCPAILASEIGRDCISELVDRTCSFAFESATRHGEDIGCTKGPIDTSKILHVRLQSN